MLAVGLIVLPLTSLVSAAGEEIGWRGFLVPRMHALLGFTGTSLLVGLIWAAWHYPINAAVFPLHRPGVPLWYANTCFTLLVIGAAFMHTWLRLRSRSVWPSTLLHASGNAFQGVLQAATRETEVTSYLTTEYGAAFAAAGCLLIVVFWIRRGEVEPRAAPGSSRSRLKERFNVDLKDRVALVTGVGRRVGIGAAIARELARGGAKVFVSFLRRYDEAQSWGGDAAMPEALLQELRSHVEADGCELDFADPTAPAALFAAALRRFGRVDILVNNAAHWEAGGGIERVDASQLDCHFAVNARAAVLLCAEFARHKVDGSPGRIPSTSRRDRASARCQVSSPTPSPKPHSTC